MSGSELKQAKARVDVLVIDPLENEGMTRKRGVSLAEGEKYLEEMRNRLAYMSSENLHVMRGSIRANALGPARNTWPGMISIKNWANALQERPETDSRLVMSYLASAAGKGAWERTPEEAVSLRKFLKKNGRPPVSEFDWRAIRERADGWRRNLDRIEARKQSGAVDGDDKTFLEAWQRMRDRVENLIFGEQVEGAKV